MGIRLLLTLLIAPVLSFTSRSYRYSPSFTSLRASEDVYIVSWDVCLDKDQSWRYPLALEVALSTWPDLERPQDTEWLVNKLDAVSHVIRQSDCCFISELALATRLMIEEQRLDGGQSNGKKGKYAKKFHPRSPSKKEQSSRRPLTVGEITANWHESIRETISTRYHVHGKDPIPILQREVSNRVRAIESLSLKVDQATIEALQAHEGPLIVTAPSSEVGIAKKALEELRLETVNLDEFEGQRILLQRDKNTVKEAMEKIDSDSIVWVIDSSWTTIQRSIRLFGDDVPRHNGIGRCGDKFLSLCLASWVQTSPDTVRSATMNSWTRLLSITEFSELVSARIT